VNLAWTLLDWESKSSRKASKLSFSEPHALLVVSIRLPMSSSTVRKLRTNLDMVLSSADSMTCLTSPSKSSLDIARPINGWLVLPLASGLSNTLSIRSGSGSTGPRPPPDDEPAAATSFRV
jgi:hypothetical protein